MKFNNFIAKMVELRCSDAKNIRARFQDISIKLSGKYHRIGVSYEVHGTILYHNMLISFLVEDIVEFVSQEINKLSRQYLLLLDKPYSNNHRDFISQQMSHMVATGEVLFSDVINFLKRAKKGMVSDNLFLDLLSISHRKYNLND